MRGLVHGVWDVVSDPGIVGVRVGDSVVVTPCEDHATRLVRRVTTEEARRIIASAGQPASVAPSRCPRCGASPGQPVVPPPEMRPWPHRDLRVVE